METGNTTMWILGTALPFAGFLAMDHFRGGIDLLGSHNWGDYMDKLRAFQWPLLGGFVLIMVLIMFKTDNTDHHDHHDDGNGGPRRLQPVRVRSQYRDR